MSTASDARSQGSARGAGGSARQAGKLPKRTLAALRGQLEQERAQLLAQISRLEADFLDPSWKEPRSDDEAEIGSSTFERERTMSLARNAKATVAEIDRALARMDAGTYGQCTQCGDPIPVERLEARPFASLCLRCQRTAERIR